MIKLSGVVTIALHVFLMSCGQNVFGAQGAMVAQEDAITIWIGNDQLVAHFTVPADAHIPGVIRCYIKKQQASRARSALCPVITNSLAAAGLGAASAIYGLAAALLASRMPKGQAGLLLEEEQEALRVHRVGFRGAIGLTGVTGTAGMYFAQRAYKKAVEPRDYCNHIIQNGEVRVNGVFHEEATTMLRKSAEYHSLVKWLCLGLTGMTCSRGRRQHIH